MTIRYPAVLDHQSPSQQWSFSDRDAILYALCVGLGGDPMNERALPFVYEKHLKVVPTLPTAFIGSASTPPLMPLGTYSKPGRLV